MKKVIFVLIILTGLSLGFYGYKNYQGFRIIQNLNPMGRKQKAETGKLSMYDFDNLRKRGGIASEIKIEGNPDAVDTRRVNLIRTENPKLKLIQAQKKMKEEMSWKSEVISFFSNGKKISGMMNTPLTPMSNKMPAIIMIRGYADAEGYYVGSGSWKAADELAKNGYITVSIDFLGFGKSDNESTDILEARFEKVMSVVDLIESVKKLPYVDPDKIGIWAHSNGGQIALSVLEVTGGNYPTTLWAPMTNPFPDSVLDTAGNDETGNKVKQVIADFEKEYDSRRYAFENYYKWIKAPLMIHQGTNDEWCQVNWQEEVVDKLVELKKEAKLYIYEGDDHNLKKNWDLVMERDIAYFGSFLKR